MNMELKFKETNKTFHKIIEVDDEKYLLDIFWLFLLKPYKIKSLNLID